MAYAISEADYENAPRISDGEDSYVKKLLLKGTTYYLYVHSYLHYGLLAARAEILKAGDESFSSCILGGYNGSYKYGGMEFKAAASPSGSSFSKCKSDAIKALNINETCTHMKCTFGGVWNGGGGDGLKSLFVASFFFDLALEVLTRFEQLVDMRVLRWALEYGRCEEVHDRLPPPMDEY